MAKGELHVLLFPWLAHGHISPYLELARRLAGNSIRVSFLSTCHNISMLSPLFPIQNLNVVELPLPHVEGLLPGLENTTDLPTKYMNLLVRAMDNMQQPFDKLLHTLNPDFVIYDLLQPWCAKSAAKLGIPAIFFFTFGVAYYAFDFCPLRGPTENLTAEDLARPPPGYPSSAISWRIDESRRRLSLYNYRIEEMTMRDRIMQCYDGCSAIVVKSCNELEQKYIQYLEEVIGKPVLPLGPLLADVRKPGPNFSQTASDKGDNCLKWMEKQKPSSVVYASFGSEYFLSEEEIGELVLGLEASQQPFLCVLRLPWYGLDDSDRDQQSRVSAILPKGFEERIGERGVIVGGWAPQREILSHGSAGGFVTHCGWSSILEGMSLGLPLIALPMQLDQALNARLVVEEFKVGVEIERASDGVLSWEEICRGVRRVMVEEELRGIRAKAAEMAEIFRNRILGQGNCGSQKRYIDEFIHYLEGLKVGSENM